MENLNRFLLSQALEEMYSKPDNARNFANYKKLN